MAEIIQSKLYMSPAPSLLNQELISELLSQIHTHVKSKKLGKVFPAPLDVYLDKQHVFQPDIVFITTKNLASLKDNGVYGAPDFVIEIISPSTEKLDSTTKKAAYENAGVMEYWLVNPKSKIASGFQLVKGKFEALGKSKGKLASPLLGLHVTF